MTAPKGAKQPEDHKPKADEPKTKSRVVTVQGHEFEVAAEALDDFELLDDLAQLDSEGGIARMPSILRRLLGSQAKTALDQLRDPSTGRVSIDAGTSFVNELMETLNPN